MSRTAMGIDHLKATGQPDPNTAGVDAPVPAGLVGKWAQAPLGFIHVEPASQVPLELLESPPGTFSPIGITGAGDQEWIYVHNPLPAATDILAGQACARAAAYGGAGAALALPAAAATSSAGVIGVAQYNIPAGFFGFILRTGPGIVTYGAGPVVGGKALIMDAALVGEVTEGATATASGFGNSIQGGGGAGTAILACQG